MPTYDYECNACGHAWELFQRITETAIKKCPECKKNKANRLFGTGAAIVFKGSGFYQTDYRSDSYKKGAKSDEKKSDSKSDGKSDAKSESASGSSSKSDAGAAKKKDSGAKSEGGTKKD